MSDLKIIHVKRQKLVKIRTRQWIPNEYCHIYVSRTDTSLITLEVKEVKYTKTAINLISFEGEYYYSDTFNEYYKTLNNKRKKNLVDCIVVFDYATMSIKEPLGLYFISDWGKVKTK